MTGIQKMVEWLESLKGFDVPIAPGKHIGIWKDDAIFKAKELAAEDEPLAVLADRKGYGIKCCEYHPVYGGPWWIKIGGYNYGKSEVFTGKTYHEAEAKARAYLNGLDDKEIPR